MLTPTVFRLYRRGHQIFPSAESCHSHADLSALLGAIVGLAPDHPATMDLSRRALAACPPDGSVFVSMGERRDTANAEEWIRATLPHALGPRGVILSASSPTDLTHRRGYAEIMLSHALLGQTELPDLQCVFQRRAESAGDGIDLAGRYQTEPPSRSASIRFSLPGRLLGLWRYAPKPVTTDSYMLFRGIAGRLQTGFRSLLRYLYLADLRRLQNSDKAQAVMMYWLSPTFRKKSHTDYTHDILHPKFAKRICSSPIKHLERELDYLHSRLTKAGDTDAAERYRKLNVHEIVKAVRSDRKPLMHLVYPEAEIVEALLAFTSYIRDVSCAELVNHTTELLRRMRHPFRKWPLPEFAHELAIWALMEATAALASSLDFPCSLTMSFDQASDSGENISTVLPLAC